MKRPPTPIVRCPCGVTVFRTTGYAEVTGWAPASKAGGINQVRRARTTGNVLCAACWAEREYGVNPNQMSMFDG